MCPGLRTCDRDGGVALICMDSDEFKYASLWLATQIESGKTSSEIAPELHQIILGYLDAADRTWGYLSATVRENIATDFFEENVSYKINGPGVSVSELAFGRLRKQWFSLIADEELVSLMSQLSLHDKNPGAPLHPPPQTP